MPGTRKTAKRKVQDAVRRVLKYGCTDEELGVVRREVGQLLGMGWLSKSQAAKQLKKIGQVQVRGR